MQRDIVLRTSHYSRSPSPFGCRTQGIYKYWIPISLGTYMAMEAAFSLLYLLDIGLTFWLDFFPCRYIRLDRRKKGVIVLDGTNLYLIISRERLDDTWTLAIGFFYFFWDYSQMSIEDAYNAIDISRCIDTPKNMSQLPRSSAIQLG